MDIHRYLVRQEGRYPWKTFRDHAVRRRNNPDLMRQLAQAIDYSGFAAPCWLRSRGWMTLGRWPPRSRRSRKR
jgi:hypothetical protein